MKRVNLFILLVAGTLLFFGCKDKTKNEASGNAETKSITKSSNLPVNSDLYYKCNTELEENGRINFKKSYINFSHSAKNKVAGRVCSFPSISRTVTVLALTIPINTSILGIPGGTLLVGLPSRAVTV